ncbi:hypothetical protein TNCV_870221 [Trichonephila clavipes]|nr:hypothetical protein TNCV_870221 [Trichonephila clavipes]
MQCQSDGNHEDATPADSAGVVRLQYVELLKVIPLEEFWPIDQSSDHAFYMRILVFQSFHFVNNFLAATTAAIIYEHLCLYVVGEGLLLVMTT